jgi:uncharacterized membrane protein HdeD (DUF308 family)
VPAVNYMEGLMDSLIEQAGQYAGTQLNKARWVLGINGALAVAFGVLILVWPGISLYALTIVFGAWVLATGLVGIFTVMGSPGAAGRGWLVFRSLLDIVVGLVVLFWPGISALALLYVIGAYAIVLGIITIGGAFWLPFSGGETAVLVLCGFAAILFGIVMFARPAGGALVVLGLIAAFALVVGTGELVLAIGGRRIVDRQLHRTFGPPKVRTSS